MTKRVEKATAKDLTSGGYYSCSGQSADVVSASAVNFAASTFHLASWLVVYFRIVLLKYCGYEHRVSKEIVQPPLHSGLFRFQHYLRYRKDHVSMTIDAVSRKARNLIVDAACAARCFFGWLDGTKWPNSMEHAQIFQRWTQKGDLRTCTFVDSSGLSYQICRFKLKATDCFFALGWPIPFRGLLLTVWFTL